MRKTLSVTKSAQFNGEMVVDYCRYHRLLIGSTPLEYMACQKVSWVSADQKGISYTIYNNKRGMYIDFVSLARMKLSATSQ